MLFNTSSTSLKLAISFLASIAATAAGCAPVGDSTSDDSSEAVSQALTSVSWAGYQWTIKAGSGLGPGPNNWSASNVFVDASGFLHLKITKSGSTWYSAELYTTTNLGFGTYQWQTDAALDTLDPNVVFGMFPYGPPTIGTDGTNEIDIEYSRWGSSTNDKLWWTVYPNSGTLIGQAHYPLSLGGGTYTTSRFTWNASSVAYRMMGGFQAPTSTTNTIQSWTYAPANPSTNIPQNAMPLHINLWLFQGHAPTNGLPVEVVIKGFSKT
jgi:hypothetical protein